MAGEKQGRGKAFRQPTLELLCFPFSYSDIGGKPGPREHTHTDTWGQESPESQGIFVPELSQRKEEAAANNSRIFANLSCFNYQGRSNWRQAHGQVMQCWETDWIQATKQQISLAQFMIKTHKQSSLLSARTPWNNLKITLLIPCARNKSIPNFEILSSV